ncbi:hypothetical protein SAMN05445850_2552 [Paraburkholderia tuberum]|uniref:Uncharacterized protein n=1 Tax=Paraburkholderia tuberum TaxID=157910 RepID=A0A1H1FSW4_9BURK|nr:hypothetical protein SAMN05445850_2552 [Paraburkholderia tuberum]
MATNPATGFTLLTVILHTAAVKEAQLTMRKHV